jgi:hypothetical protein
MITYNYISAYLNSCNTFKREWSCRNDTEDEEVLTRLRENGPVGMTQKTPQTIVVHPAVKVC